MPAPMRVTSMFAGPLGDNWFIFCLLFLAGAVQARTAASMTLSAALFNAVGRR
jgi:hypothetical protein